MAVLALDSDIASLYLRGYPPVVEQILHRTEDTIALPIIVAQELLAGWLPILMRRQNSEQTVRAFADFRRTLEFVFDFPLLDFDRIAAEHFERLRPAHRRLGQNDLRIAAIALAAGAVLVTRNTTHFNQIRGLTLADWA